MTKELLMVTHSQFGYIAGYVQYCKYLKSNFNITFLCWDYGKEILSEDNVNVYYISRKGNLITRNIRFIITVLNFIKSEEYYRVFMCYFLGCSIIPLLYKRKGFIH